MKCALILLAIICVCVQEHAANPEDIEARRFFLKFPSAETIRNDIYDLLSTIELAYQNTLIYIEKEHQKFLHGWLSNEYDHFTDILHREQEVANGAGEHCISVSKKIYDLFDSEFDDTTKCIHAIHLAYSRITLKDMFVEDMPQSLNVYEWLWYIIKLPSLAFEVFLDVASAVQDMENGMRKCNDHTLKLVRANIEDFIKKELYPCIDSIQVTTVAVATVTDKPGSQNAVTLFPDFKPVYPQFKPTG